MHEAATVAANVVYVETPLVMLAAVDVAVAVECEAPEKQFSKYGWQPEEQLTKLSSHDSLARGLARDVLVDAEAAVLARRSG